MHFFLCFRICTREMLDGNELNSYQEHISSTENKWINHVNARNYL
jgi:hypothetical protein